jgi:hypothetical protein
LRGVDCAPAVIEVIVYFSQRRRQRVLALFD